MLSSNIHVDCMMFFIWLSHLKCTQESHTTNTHVHLFQNHKVLATIKYMLAVQGHIIIVVCHHPSHLEYLHT